MDNEPLEFREALPEEFEFLTELAIRSKSHWPYTEQYLAQCRSILKFDADYLIVGKIFVLEQNHKILGFYSLIKKADLTWIDNLWLEPNDIGKGVGKILYEEAVRMAKSLGNTEIRLVADPFAMNFYVKRGCKHIGFEPSKARAGLFLPLFKVP